MVFKTKKTNMNMVGVERVFAIFKAINGRYPKLDVHDDRLNIQKLTYMLQSLSLPFHYRFNWYFKGPYSPTLASEAFGYVEKGIDKGIELTVEEKKAVSELQLAFSRDITEPNKLELYASLLFLKKQNKWNFSEDGEKLADKLVSLKPWFTREDATSAIATLKNSGIFGS